MPGHGRGEQDHPHPGHQRRHPQAHQRAAEQGLAQPGHRRGQRRKVDVAQGQVVARHQVVELVAVIAVAAVGGEGQADLGPDDGQQGPTGRPQPPARRGAALGAGRTAHRLSACLDTRADSLSPYRDRRFCGSGGAQDPSLTSGSGRWNLLVGQEPPVAVTNLCQWSWGAAWRRSPLPEGEGRAWGT